MPHSPNDVSGHIPSPTGGAYQNISGIVVIVLESAMVLANVLPILVVVWRKRPRERLSTDHVILALSVTDILSVIIPSPFGLVSYFSRHWYGGYNTCAFYQLTITWFQLTSLFLVTFMCVDRLQTVTAALRQQIALQSSIAVKYNIFLIYLITLGIACLPLVHLGPDALSESGNLCQSWLIAQPKLRKEHTFYIVVLSAGCVNLLTVVVANTRVHVLLRKYLEKLKESEAASDEKKTTVVGSSDRKAVVDCSKMVGVITLVCYLAWLPALIMILLLKLEQNVNVAVVLYSMASTTLTGLLNPVIYAIFSPSYRSGYKAVFRSVFNCLCVCRQKPFDMIDDVSTRASRLRSETSQRSIASILTRSERNDLTQVGDLSTLDSDVVSPTDGLDPDPSLYGSALYTGLRVQRIKKKKNNRADRVNLTYCAEESESSSLLNSPCESEPDYQPSHSANTYLARVKVVESII